MWVPFGTAIRLPVGACRNESKCESGVFLRELGGFGAVRADGPIKAAHLLL